MTFDLSLYDDEFFIWHKIHAREYSIRNMDWYIKNYKPESVIDFGCAIGSYLESAHNHGIQIVGVEISEAARKHTPESIRPFIQYMDCIDQLLCGVPFDTVLSFETAEHIDPAGTDQFIQNLINATGKRLLFTAAPPGQQGTGHINLRPKQFWIDEFSKELTYNEKLSREISSFWGLQGAPYYIVNNLIVFER